MAKRKEPVANGSNGPALLPGARSRRRSGLFLRRFLADEADKVLYRTKTRDEAHEIVKRWADLEAKGHLAKKETALDAAFLQEVFGDALGYRSHTESPEDYQRERNFTVDKVGVADGALGNFRSGVEVSPLAVIELKDAGVNLDRDRSGGRTPVQQLWGYLNALPDCPWGILSNFVTIRLYHRSKGSQDYEKFTLQELRGEKRFAEFYCIFERGGLVRSWAGRPLRAVELLQRTEDRQREVGDELYDYYGSQRLRLIEHLIHKQGHNLETAIYVAQRILDRIIFVAFCEDRDLLREKTIDEVYRTVPPFAKVINPRWRNFLLLFRAMDKGHRDMPYLETGFNGGLFKEDPKIDDLQLDDDWTEFFKRVGDYDFRDEVNVDVLGHLFEKSVAEIEKLRTGGLFGLVGEGPGDAGSPAMKKSAERKRFGTYYTPPEFTELIVRETVGEAIRERLEAVRSARGLNAEEIESEKPSDELAAYWRDCLAALRTIKVCDPACGSGAFLIAAYDALEAAYHEVVDRLIFHDGPDADELADDVPDMILADNLYGADVSQQAVEIAQLALWLRSAQRGRRLADLSQNVVWKNSLVTDPAVHEHAMQWERQFPEVFARAGNPGFDCVVGNPPWERMKLQEREFFAISAPKIAGAVSAASRRKLIAELETANPELFSLYQAAKTSAENTLAHVRQSGNFPLTAKGDVNTYMVFTELARRIVAPRGRVGLLVPSGIATDHTTREFFGRLMQSQSLIRLYDFENKAPFFPDVHRAFKFSVLVFGGAEVKTPAADFAFFLHDFEELDDAKRHIPLSVKDMALMNPNTRTCPVFRSRRDAELTKAVYHRVPILIDKNRKQGGNPWGIKFVRMFDQTNDAELFLDREQLMELGAKQQGNRWKKGRRAFLPLYEAKMVQAYDHRAAGVVIEKSNWMRQGQTEPTTPVFHQNPEFVVQPRWWVEEKAVVNALGKHIADGFMGFKDITSPTNQRTMIAAAIPWSAVTNHFPLIMTDVSARLRLCLLANLNSHILDYVARQKIGGVTLNFFIVEQFPMFPPDRYSERCPWDKRWTLERW
ncbi:MAG: N-6 DNA methylase, partial [Planctomycetes bacterium]|nr:N-6 DNA methylase [Planctomycetota bacterium]